MVTPRRVISNYNSGRLETVRLPVPNLTILVVRNDSWNWNLLMLLCGSRGCAEAGRELGGWGVCWER